MEGLGLVAAGTALLLIGLGVWWWRRAARVPAGPPGFGPADLDSAGALALLEPTALPRLGRDPRAGIPLRGVVDGVDAVLFDLSYQTTDARRTCSVLVLQQDGLRLPVFSLRPRPALEAQPELAEGEEVELPDSLATRYRLSGPAQGDVRLFFGAAVREILEGAPGLWLEAAPGRLAVVSQEPLSEEERGPLVEQARAALDAVRAA